jgi:hypothetical protein
MYTLRERCLNCNAMTTTTRDAYAPLADEYLTALTDCEIEVEVVCESCVESLSVPRAARFYLEA